MNLVVVSSRILHDLTYANNPCWFAKLYTICWNMIEQYCYFTNPVLSCQQFCYKLTGLLSQHWCNNLWYFYACTSIPSGHDQLQAHNLNNKLQKNEINVLCTLRDGKGVLRRKCKIHIFNEISLQRLRFASVSGILAHFTLLRLQHFNAVVLITVKNRKKPSNPRHNTSADLFFFFHATKSFNKPFEFVLYKTNR